MGCTNSKEKIVQKPRRMRNRSLPALRSKFEHSRSREKIVISQSREGKKSIFDISHRSASSIISHHYSSRSSIKKNSHLKSRGSRNQSSKNFSHHNYSNKNRKSSIKRVKIFKEEKIISEKFYSTRERKSNGMDLVNNGTQTDNDALKNYFIEELKKKRRELDDLLDMTHNVKSQESGVNMSRLSSIYNNNKVKFSNRKRNSSTRPDHIEPKSNQSRKGSNENLEKLEKEKDFYVKTRRPHAAMSEINLGKNRKSIVKGLSSISNKKRMSIKSHKKKGKSDVNRSISEEGSNDDSKAVIFRVKSRKGNSYFRKSGTGISTGSRESKREGKSAMMSGSKSIKTPKDTILTANNHPLRTTNPDNTLKLDSIASRSKIGEYQKMVNFSILRNRSNKVSFSQKSFTQVFSQKNSPTSSIMKRNIPLKSVKGVKQYQGILRNGIHRLSHLAEDKLENMSLNSEGMKKVENEVKKRKRRMNMSMIYQPRVPSKRKKRDLNTSISRVGKNNLAFLKKMKKRSAGGNILNNLDNNFRMISRKKRRISDHQKKDSKEVLEEFSKESEETERSEKRVELKKKKSNEANEEANGLLSALQLMNEDNKLDKSDPQINNNIPKKNFNIFSSNQTNKFNKKNLTKTRQKTGKFAKPDDLNNSSIKGESSLSASDDSSSILCDKSLHRRRQFLTSKIFENGFDLESKTNNFNSKPQSIHMIDQSPIHFINQQTPNIPARVIKNDDLRAKSKTPDVNFGQLSQI